MSEGKRSGNDLAQAIEDRLDVPVLVAALVSVPAVFLTMTSGIAIVIGAVLNFASGAVLVGESLMLFLISRERLAWIREHRLELVLAVATVPGVVLLVGPVQIFRLLIFLSAVRMLRVRRILGAADVIRRRANLPRRYRRLAGWGVTGIAVVFVAVVLADPKSVSRRLVDRVVEQVGLTPVVIAGLLVVATVLLARWYRPVDRLKRRRRDPTVAAEE